MAGGEVATFRLQGADRESYWRALTSLIQCRPLTAYVAVLLLVLVGRGALAQTDRLASIHRVAIISALGDHATIWRIGITVFDSKGGNLPIGDWDLDGVAAQKAAELLGGRFEIVPVAHVKESFIPSDAPSLYPRENPSLGPLIRALPEENVDAYLVIRRITWYPSYPNNFALIGVGAVKSRVLNADQPSVFAAYEIVLVQARTGKTIAHMDSSQHHIGFDAISEPEDAADWADSADRMTQVQKDELHQHLAAHIGDSLQRTLTAMGLVGR